MIVVCISVADSTPGSLAHGSRMARCGACRARVWIAPSSDTAAPGAELLCIPCALALAAESGVVQVQAPTAEQWAELEAWRAGRRS